MSIGSKKSETNNKNVEDAIELMRNEIQQGRFAPGQRLIEIDVMQHLGITRGRVREVFKRLETEGLVQIDKNRGASVRKASKEEVENIFEVLEEVSILIVKKVAKQLNEQQNRKRLQESLTIARKFHADSDRIYKVQDYMKENARFWGVLAEISGNKVLSEIRTRLQAPLFRLAMEGLTVNTKHEQWITRHEDIISAILEHDVNHASRHARKSMHDVWKAILALPDSAFAR
ncbi:MAG: GntR family transcriptional regulator [Gammaproteobacteria bacterium]|jgi:DNA-binding GntR family transcriptional regulator|nr:GntR family transcriptional regulator [Gammaproteobacteria bacterium]